MPNRCMFVGRIVKDPELTETSNGNKICRFSLAVKRDFATGNNQVDFVNFIAFGNTAQYVASYGKKGMLCYVESRFQTFTKNGNEPAQKPENGYNFVVDKFDILSTKKEMAEYNNKEQVENSPYPNSRKPYNANNTQRNLIEENFDDGFAIPF